MSINKINKKILNRKDAGEFPGFHMSFLWQKGVGIMKDIVTL